MEIFTSLRVQEVVVHDLRTPLNVINLALKMLGDATAGCPDLAEDIELIRSNVAELDRMLSMLIDASKVPCDAGGLNPQCFCPSQMVKEVVAVHCARAGADAATLELGEIPHEVTLDYARSRLALQKALANAATAAGDQPVVVRANGGPDRWVVAFEAAVPPRSSVASHDVQPEEFQRITGTPAERRGLDLAIAGKVSELFGGSARIESIPGAGTTVILDWPVSVGA